MAIVFAIGMLNGGYYAFFTGAPLIYMNALGYTAREFSLIVMLWGVGFFITGFVVTRMIGRISAHATILGGSALNIATSLYWIAAAYLSGNPFLLVLPVLTFAASNALFVPRAMNVALTVAPVEIAGAASAMIAFSQWGFSAVGSGASTVVSHDSPATMGFLMLGFVTVSLLIYLAGGRPAASAKGA
jgi:DHA1 family bicyclomycin/chloramphenicol resistance-like MFS transporter